MFPYCLVYGRVSLRSIKNNCHASSLKDSLCRHCAKQCAGPITRSTVFTAITTYVSPISPLYSTFLAESKYEKMNASNRSVAKSCNPAVFHVRSAPRNESTDSWQVAQNTPFPGNQTDIRSLVLFFFYRVWFLFVFPRLPGQPCVRWPKSSSSPLKDMFSCAVADGVAAGLQRFG